MKEHLTETLTGTVEDIVFRNEETGFTVLDLAVNDELVTVVGEALDIQAGEELTVTGEIVAAGMSSITIRTEDGEETSYLKEGTELDMEGDQVEGTVVTITYVERDGMNYALRITDAQ